MPNPSQETSITPWTVYKTGVGTIGVANVAQIVIPAAEPESMSLAVGALTSNTSSLWLGDSTVTLAAGQELSPGAAAMLRLNHRFTPVYIVGAGAQGYWWAYVR